MSKSYNQKQIELNSLFRTISLKPKYSSTQKLLLKHGNQVFWLVVLSTHIGLSVITSLHQ